MKYNEGLNKVKYCYILMKNLSHIKPLKKAIAFKTQFYLFFCYTMYVVKTGKEKVDSNSIHCSLSYLHGNKTNNRGLVGFCDVTCLPV